MAKVIPFRMILAVAAAALLATATLVILVIVVVTDSKPAEAAFPGENGKIAFVRDILDNNPDPDAENWEIYTMDPDGTNQKSISASDHLDHHPDWSPDGTKIAFWSDRDGNDSEIYIMGAGGGSQTKLTSNDVDDRAPSWQPLP